MTEEARNLIAQALNDLGVLNLPKGKILYIPHSATDEQIQAAISYFEKVLKDEAAGSENAESNFIKIPLDKTHR